MASAKWRTEIFSSLARSAMVRATFSILCRLLPEKLYLFMACFKSSCSCSPLPAASCRIPEVPRGGRHDRNPSLFFLEMESRRRLAGGHGTPVLNGGRDAPSLVSIPTFLLPYRTALPYYRRGSARLWSLLPLYTGSAERWLLTCWLSLDRK